MTVGMIAAVSRNGVIGDGVRMPWHLPEDLAHFKHTTMGHTLLMGRRTFDSIGRALPGRRSIVLTRNTRWSHADVEVAHTFAEGLALAGPTELWVVGGGEVGDGVGPLLGVVGVGHGVREVLQPAQDVVAQRGHGVGRAGRRDIAGGGRHVDHARQGGQHGPDEVGGGRGVREHGRGGGREVRGLVDGAGVGHAPHRRRPLVPGA